MTSLNLMYTKLRKYYKKKLAIEITRVSGGCWRESAGLIGRTGLRENKNVLRRHDLTRSDVTIEKTAWRCVAFRDFEDICIGRSKQLTTIACGPFLCCTTKRKNLHIDQSAPEWAKNTAKRMNTVYARGDINGSCSRHLVGACIL